MLYTGALISYWTSFLMFLLQDPSCGMTKLSCMIKHFQIDIEKPFVKFHSRTIRLSKAFTVLMFKYDIS